MKDDFTALLEFNQWADELVVQALNQLTPEQYTQAPAPDSPSIRGIFVHMADASLIWARRIAGEHVAARTSEADVPTLEEAIAFLARTHESWRLLLPTLSPDRLSAPLLYHDLKGEPKSLPLWAVLRHQLNHSTYHRGQIASNLMRFGIEPPLIDLAIWASQQQ